MSCSSLVVPRPRGEFEIHDPPNEEATLEQKKICHKIAQDAETDKVEMGKLTQSSRRQKRISFGNSRDRVCRLQE